MKLKEPETAETLNAVCEASGTTDITGPLTHQHFVSKFTELFDRGVRHGGCISQEV